MMTEECIAIHLPTVSQQQHKIATKSQQQHKTATISQDEIPPTISFENEYRIDSRHGMDIAVARSEILHTLVKLFTLYLVCIHFSL